MPNESPARIAVITDSVGQVPPEAARRLGITIMPLTVQIDGKSFLDGVDIAPAELYRRMRVEGILPTTSAPSIGEYEQVFLSCLRGGARGLLCVTLSSKLSMAYSAACQAAKMVRDEFPDRRVEVLDSKQATICQGFITMAAARAVVEGKPWLEVLQAAEEMKRRVGFAVTLQTLEYLARGGRIGRAAFMGGSLLNIKPIISLDEEGTVVPIGRVQGEKHALESIVDRVARQTEGHKSLQLAVMEAGAREQAAKLRNLALQKMQPVEVFDSEFTPVMGVHTGPGLVGLAYCYE
jgi:DegV family protein with EDD domain